jgi:outer membrane protein assembly factor BamE (lipoprotein component of BamABCDE complex)
MKKILVFLFAVGLSGCMSASQTDWARAKQIRIGSTEAEVVALIGKPDILKTNGPDQTWVYRSNSYATSEIQVAAYGLRDGVVTIVPVIPF